MAAVLLCIFFFTGGRFLFVFLVSATLFHSAVYNELYLPINTPELIPCPLFKGFECVFIYP